VQRYREESREARTFAWIHDLVGDLRYAARTLRRSPLFTSASIVSLGLGIGVNVAVFGLFYGVLLQPLPIPRPRELAALTVSYKGDVFSSVLRRTYLTLRAAPGAPELVALHVADNVLVETPVAREYARVDLVDGGFFPLLGVAPVIGRVIVPDDDASQTPVTVISDETWSRFFARAPDVLGKQVVLHGAAFTVVGVMPPSFRGIRFNGSFALAVPASAAPALGVEESRNYVNVVARVETPAQRAAFAGLLDAAFKRCCRDAEKMAADIHVSLVDASSGIPYGKDDFREDYRLVLWSLMGGVLLVLLIACSNVGNLLLARGAARARELSIRLSIGASRARIVRQLLAESALLATLGALVGLALAAIANHLLIASLPAGLETAAALVAFDVTPPVLGFTATIAAISVIAFGVGPALRATRGDRLASLSDRTGARSRDARVVDRLLVILQVAITLVLVCGAGLLVATLRNLRAVNPGFVSTHLVGVNIETRGTPLERTGIVPLYPEILERVRAVSGVQAAAMATRIPAIGGRDVTFPYAVGGRSAREPGEVSVTATTPGYFATSKTSLVAGRDFAETDTRSAPRIAVANEMFVRRHFAGSSPIGATVRIDGLNGGEEVTLVGVARDVRLGDRRSPPDPTLYVPAAQGGPWPFLLLLMRTGPEPGHVMPAVMRALDPFARRVRVGKPLSMDEAFDAVLLRERLAAALASICAALALLLAMVGLAGLVGFSVTRRTREIGVRMALGAQRAGVVWLVLRGAVTLALAGVVLGGPLALGTGQWLRSLLYGIAPTSLLVFCGASSALVAVAILASVAPAWRASRVDPVIALRAD
jgi:putative ABC transport system permease protein